jgi:hypothetical protein
MLEQYELDYLASLRHPYEEEYNGFIIYIERNPDPYRGGYIWQIIDDEQSMIIEDELCFDKAVGLEQARNRADQLRSAPASSADTDSDCNH